MQLPLHLRKVKRQNENDGTSNCSKRVRRAKATINCSSSGVMNSETAGRIDGETSSKINGEIAIRMKGGPAGGMNGETASRDNR